jgi:glycosyltransferase involved in cell wall biosynthesis
MARDVALWKDIKSLVDIYLALKRIKPDMVQVSTPKTALLGAIAASLARVPIRIYLMTGLHSSSKNGLKKLLYMVLESVAPRMCTVTRCNSPSLLRYAVKHRIVPEKKAVLLGHGMSNGLDTAHFDRARVKSAYDLNAMRAKLGIPESCEVIGFCGRFTRDKGLRELLEAWLIIREQFPNVRLLLVGWWWEEVDLVEQDVRESLVRDPRVHITGRIEDTAPYYALMTMLIHPSYREGFPNAPMEAAAMELPVVASNAVGCVDAVVDGVTGTLVSVGSSSALVSAISRYLSDPQLRKRHGKAGRERILKHFRQAMLWEEIYRFYKELLRTKGISPIPCNPT